MVNMKPKNFHLSHNWITFKLWKINHFRLCSDAHFVPFLFYYYCKWVRIWNEKWKQWPRKGYSYWDIYFSFCKKYWPLNLSVPIYRLCHRHLWKSAYTQWTKCENFIRKLLRENIVFCFQNCSDFLWEKNILLIVKKIWISRSKTKNLQKKMRSLDQFI